jgi:hypothetical protein
MNARRLLLGSALACAAVAGCGTYIEAKQNIAPGGKLETETAEARQTLASVKKENVQLQSTKLQRERELERNERRIQALETDLRQHDAALASALSSRRLTKARHDQLKRDLDAIRKETAAIGQQNDADRLGGVSDPKADAAKEARLRALEQRKKELEAALATLVKR